MLFVDGLEQESTLKNYELKGPVEAFSAVQKVAVIRSTFSSLHDRLKIAFGHLTNFEEAHGMSHGNRDLKLRALFVLVVIEVPELLELFVIDLVLILRIDLALHDQHLLKKLE